MKTLHMMLVRSFLPVFVLALVFFSMILQLADLFGSLLRYLNFDVGITDILQVQLLYFPKTISYSLPVALLFAVAFTLGNLYSNNELISVFGSGVSLYRLILPFLAIGLILSIGGYYFEESVVIDTFKQKNDLSRELLRQRTSFSNTDITLLSADGKIVYHADYYNDTTKTLNGVMILIRDENGKFLERIDADTMTWDGSVWKIRQGRLFYWNEDSSALTERQIDDFSHEALQETPETFRNTSRNIEEMKTAEAKEWIESLRLAGIPVRNALTEYYKRFSFALTPFIVAFISSAIGGRFKKNILLMSLLLSLVVSVVYYVTQMVSVILAKLDYIPPISGAWTAFILFLIIGMVLFRTART